MGYVVDLTNSLNIKASFISGGDAPVIPTPDYDLTELEQQLHDDAIARLNLVNPNHKYMAFGFITDLHESYDGVGYGGPLITSKPSLKLLSAIAKTYNLDGVFFGGDYSLGDGLSYEQYDAALRDLSDMVNASFTVPHFATEGNHDRWKSGNANNHCRGNTEWKRFLTGFNTPNMAVFPTRNDSENGYIANTYYVDFSKYKVRVVMRSEYEKQESVGSPVGNSEGAGHFSNNLRDCLTFGVPSVAKNWTALCISHYSWNAAGKNGDYMMNQFLNGGLNNGVTGKAAVGEIFGHVHYVTSAVHTMNETTGTLVRIGQTNAFATDLVSSGNSSYVNDDYRFSLYIVDTNSFNLHEIKVGVQYNRTGNPYYNSNTRIFSYPFRHNEQSVENAFKFYHISDIHNTSEGIAECKSMMDNPDDTAAFTIFTGDFATDTYTSVQNQALKEPMKSFSSEHDLLAVLGNHDAWEGFVAPGLAGSNSSKSAAAFIKDIMSDKVTFGDVNNNIPQSSYWHKDYPLPNGSKLRVIGIDQYQYRNKTEQGYTSYDVMYLQSQVDWFISRIKELNSDDYFLVALHEPPVNKNSESAIASRRHNSFCSSKLLNWGNGVTNGELWPFIVDAYKHKKKVVNQIIYNQNRSTGEALTSVVVNEDFQNISPCKFLGYLCGHIHADIHLPHPNPEYSDQLIMCIDCSTAYRTSKTNHVGPVSDIVDRPFGNVLINEVSIDFDNEIITISRIGNKDTVAANGFPALRRTQIQFGFDGSLVNELYESL